MPLFLLQQPALASLVAPSGIQSHRWTRAGGQQSIAYEVAAAGPTKAPPVLLLNGFGVGSFHWHRVMRSIASESGSVCYGMDYLGQGGSWPVDCADGDAPSEAGLRRCFVENKASPEDSDHAWPQFPAACGMQCKHGRYVAGPA